jgi:integrase
MAVLQSVLSFAIVEGLTEFNTAASVKKPRYVRARQPRVFSPVDVEHLRCLVATPLDRTLISVLAYSGARPEEALRLTWPDIGPEALHYHDSKRGHRERWTPLLDHLRRDLREWHLVCGRPHKGPVFPAHDGDHWQLDDWRNWRTRAWREIAPAGSVPRDLRGSFITLRVYEGIPLTTVAREAGTSVAMIDKHYAGVIANWDGTHIPADKQIEAARAKVAEDRKLRRRAGW